MKRYAACQPTFEKVLFLLFMLSFAAFAYGCGDEPADSLAEQVRALRVGFEPYHIGDVLSAEQQKTAQKALQPDAYAGTYKFQDQDLMVVADKSSHVILAMYRQIDRAGPDELKKIIVDLMDKFGQPSASGHDKVIYWAYGENGKITDQQIRKAKKTGKLQDVLATVKLNSSGEFPDSAKKGKPQAEASVYILISSPPLLKRLVKKQ